MWVARLVLLLTALHAAVLGPAGVRQQGSSAEPCEASADPCDAAADPHVGGVDPCEGSAEHGEGSEGCSCPPDCSDECSCCARPVTASPAALLAATAPRPPTRPIRYERVVERAPPSIEQRAQDPVPRLAAAS